MILLLYLHIEGLQRKCGRLVAISKKTMLRFGSAKSRERHMTISVCAADDICLLYSYITDKYHAASYMHISVMSFFLL